MGTGDSGYKTMSVQGAECRVQGSGSGFKVRVQGSGFRVQGSRSGLQKFRPTSN
jgi:hypothetical protein